MALPLSSLIRSGLMSKRVKQTLDAKWMSEPDRRWVAVVGANNEEEAIRRTFEGVYMHTDDWGDDYKIDGFQDGHLIFTLLTEQQYLKWEEFQDIIDAGYGAHIGEFKITGIGVETPDDLGVCSKCLVKYDFCECGEEDPSNE